VEPADLASELIINDDHQFLEPCNGLGERVYYSAGLASLTAFASAAGMPRTSVFWIAARILLDSAGGLFGLYLVVMVGLLLAGRAMRLRRRLTERLSRPAA
jgi:formate hydrogenlyase subunit 3/multisubunit Na+/H+ antiporter MnhD subunit